jgi:hypothetical protein
MAIVNHSGDTIGTPKQAAAAEIFRLVRDNEHMNNHVNVEAMTAKQKEKYIEQYNAYFERIKKTLGIK